MASSNAPITASRPILPWLAPALLLALGVIVILSDSFGIETRLSNQLFDAYQRHAPRPLASDMPVRVLELPVLDEDSLVSITRILSARGADLIVFTPPVLLGPSPQSLAARLPPGSDEARAALARLPEPGHDLAAAIADSRAVIPVMLGLAGRSPSLKAHFVYRGTRDPFGRVPVSGAAAAMPPILENNAAGSGAANLIPDRDGVVRRMPIVFRVGSVLVPSLATEVLRVAGEKTDITVTSNEHDPLSFLSGIGIAALETANGMVPTDDRGQVRLRYAANASDRLLNPDTRDSLAGVTVVVGTEGRTMLTPLGTASVASVFAETIEDLIGNTVLTRPGWARPLEALALALLGTATVLLLRLGLGWAAALIMGGAALMGLASWYLYVAQGLLTDAATPTLFLALSFAAGALVWIHDLRVAYAGLRLAFSDSLPRAAIEKIARRPGLLKLDGEIRTVTYLVCRLRGLEHMAANYHGDAAGFANLMQRALTPLIDHTLAHGGTIDRLTADGFAAFWNAPLEDDNHALHACEAASAMATHKNDETQSPKISVGIATGPVIAGGFGGYGRMGYGVHGDAVTLAQRIQALSSHYGTELIVADETRRQAERSFAFLEIDAIATAPGGPPTTLYALLGDTGSRSSPKYRALAVFHDHIFQAIRKQHWQMARELIAQCRRLSGASQRIYDLHLARIGYYETHPPGADWDGAFRPILE